MRTALRRRLPLTAVAIVALSGCVLASDAVVAENDTGFDPRLLGTWENAPDSDRAVITRGAGNEYSIEFTNARGQAGTFHARLGRLGGRSVLDVWPADPALDDSSAAAEMFVPQHLVLAIDIADDEVRTAVLNPDSVTAALDGGQLSSPFITSQRRIVLLGTTTDLRRALTPYVARPGAFAEPDVWRRAGAAAGGR